MKKNLKINSSALWLRNFPWKKKRDHKYSRGKLICIGGPKGYTGAAILSVRSAYKTGVGIIKIIGNFFYTLAFVYS